MSMLVDTCVWSLALRRDADQTAPEVLALQDAIFGADQVVTTGLILQELLQGFSGPKARAQLIERFAVLALIQPDRDDHILLVPTRRDRADIPVGWVERSETHRFGAPHGRCDGYRGPAT